MQKTIEGLLRGILHSALLGLSQCAESGHVDAIKHICGSRWKSATANGAWSRRELKQMLTRFTSLSKVKNFLLIDALDECEPQDRLGDLANEIWWISQLPNVKLCVSCRPWEVFTRKFESSVSLRLDQLTRRDMETYVGARLIAAEEERGWDAEFKDETHAAKLLIQNVARSAEGVFLWTELVVTAMCSEIRKGSRVERLSHIISEFPSDLDEYFHRLIFDRIGRSRQNVEDTAAALRLAIIVHASTQKGATDFPDSHPFADSYMNFWLLVNGHLSAGFSWTDSEGISLPSDLQMLDQTAGYLEETCKDLLVLNRTTESVGFLHRTVFDFLSATRPYETLAQKEPNHFSGKDFIFNLARLRCVCLLRTQHASCEALASALGEILSLYEHLTHLDQHATWLSKIESVSISQIRENRRLSYWIPLPVLDVRMSTCCVRAGLSRFLLEFYKDVPTLAFGHTPDGIDNPLCEYLHATMQSGIREPDLSLLQHFMNIGYDPNRSVGRWPHIWIQRYPFSSHEEVLEKEEEDMPPCCKRTVWTAWVGEAFMQFAKMKSVTSNETLLRQKRQAAAIAILLLQQGADPHCMVCTTDHWVDSVTTCSLIALDQVMEAIVPTESLTMLRDLRDLCSNQATGYALRRNQRMRAVRSHHVTEQFYASLANGDDASQYRGPRCTPVSLISTIEDTAGVEYDCCNRCFGQGRAGPILASWCLNCDGLSVLCYACFKRNPSERPILRFSCEGDHRISKDTHTSVTFVCYNGDMWNDHKDKSEGYRNSLELQGSTARAIATMREWYAEGQTEADLSFEDVVRKTRKTSPSHQTQESGTIIGEVPTEQGGRSTRPWLL